MAHAEFPEEIARDNKHAGDDGQKHRAGIVVAANEELVAELGRDRKSTRLNSIHDRQSRMPSSA